MQKTSTPEDLIRLLYNETSLEEASEMDADMIDHPSLSAEFHQLKEATDILDAAFVRPEKGIVQAILGYSRSLRIEESASTGKTVEFVLN